MQPAAQRARAALEGARVASQLHSESPPTSLGITKDIYGSAGVTLEMHYLESWNSVPPPSVTCIDTPNA
jgi:hypothetical protein